MAKGWLKINGVQDGERTLQEQMLGLDAALLEANGKTVLDLGCAEGLIAIEFAKAGASSVVGYDYNETFIDVAKKQQTETPDLPIDFYHADITKIGFCKYDIVLALAILHKLPDPTEFTKYCTRIAKDLIVIRLPIGSTGYIRSKHARHMTADIPKILSANGFVRERKESGPRGEVVQYWRRVS